MRRSPLRRRGLRLACVAAIGVVGLWSSASFAASTAAAPAARDEPPATSLRHAGAAPGWQPVPGQPVPVTSPGDVVQVDLRGRPGRVRMTLYLTNLPELRKGYASFVLPVGIWSSSTPVDRSSWRRAGEAVLTDAEGKVELELAGGRYYDLTLEAGGSLVALPGAASYSPSFYAAAD